MLLTWWRRLALFIEKLVGCLPLVILKCLRDFITGRNDVKKEILTFWVLQFNIMIKVSPDNLINDCMRAMESFLEDKNRLFQLVKLLYYIECILDADWLTFLNFCLTCPRIYIWNVVKITCILKYPKLVRNALIEARQRDKIDEFYYVDMSDIPAF